MYSITKKATLIAIALLMGLVSARLSAMNETPKYTPEEIEQALKTLNQPAEANSASGFSALIHREHVSPEEWVNLQQQSKNTLKRITEWKKALKIVEWAIQRSMNVFTKKLEMSRKDAKKYDVEFKFDD